MQESPRQFPRIKIKEQKCVIHDGTKYLPIGADEREVIAIILDLSVGGASLRTNISSRLNASFTLHLPKIGNLEAFSIKSEIVRLATAEDSQPRKPRYLMGLKFIDPDAKLIKSFLELASKSPETAK